MAKVTGPFTIQGKVGHLIFKKTDNGQEVQSMCGPTRQQVLTSKNFVNTRRNAREFAASIRDAQLLRRAMGSALNGIRIKRLSGDMNGLFRRMANGDKTHGWGKRHPTLGDVSRLKGFEFNQHLSLQKALRMDVTHSMDIEKGHTQLTIPAFMARRHKAMPKTASHYRIISCVVAVNFTSRRYRQSIQESVIMPLSERNKTPLQAEHTLKPLPEEVLIHIAGIELYEEKGSRLELLTKGAMSILEALRHPRPAEETKGLPVPKAANNSGCYPYTLKASFRSFVNSSSETMKPVRASMQQTSMMHCFSLIYGNTLSYQPSGT